MTGKANKSSHPSNSMLIPIPVGRCIFCLVPDLSSIKSPEIIRSAILSVAALILFIVNFLMRSSAQPAGCMALTLLSFIGVAVILVSGWLGGTAEACCRGCSRIFEILFDVVRGKLTTIKKKMYQYVRGSPST